MSVVLGLCWAWRLSQRKAFLPLVPPFARSRETRSKPSGPGSSSYVTLTWAQKEGFDWLAFGCVVRGVIKRSATNREQGLENAYRGNVDVASSGMCNTVSWYPRYVCFVGVLGSLHSFGHGGEVAVASLWNHCVF